ncbi:MAG: hypothetical protein IJ822_05510, partial [Pyramidobacter sp.]|nr:hypothetical protein [Pyramidobacter sp.]
ELTTQSGGATTITGPVTAGDLTSTAGSSIVLEKDVSAAGNVSLKANDIETRGVTAGGDLTAAAQHSLNMTGDASAGSDVTLTANEIAVRDVSAGNELTALSQTTFSGNDLTAGDDVRVHTYGDMTFNNAKAGGDAWILGIGSSAARMKFHSVSARGLDTAVLLERGYLDYWKVTAGLDGAAAVRYFEGPKLAGALEQGTKIRVYFPYGGSLMPKDPFHFHVRDLLQNSDLEPQERDVLRMWPPRDRRVPDPNLQAGSDNIEIYLDDYEYWLPKPDLSVSER